MSVNQRNPRELSELEKAQMEYDFIIAHADRYPDPEAIKKRALGEFTAIRDTFEARVINKPKELIKRVSLGVLSGIQR